MKTHKILVAALRLTKSRMLNSRRHQSLANEDSHLDRWLVSYADYMTLLFALFVVLYAFALVKEEKHAILSNSLGEIFHLSGRQGHGGQGQVIQNSSDTPLTSGDKVSEQNDFNKGLLDAAGSEPVEGDSQLVNPDMQQLGTPFSSMKEKLAQDLLEVVEKGYAQIEQDDNWLTIEFRSGLLFDSGSAVSRKATKTVLKQVINTIAPANNYVHVRGYTDDQSINNEQFQSNWQLSSARASAIVQELQLLNIAPERLAIEAYGQYRPKINNSDQQSRAKNRRVVIAISKFGWIKPKISEQPALRQEPSNAFIPVQDSNEIQIIELPNGGLRITTRKQE